MNNIIRHRTPDTGWAWVISVSIGAINGLTFGLIRSFGVFFFYLRQEFEISRQVASWPFALCTSCTYLTGPITGLLISYFHLRTIVFVGILFTSAGFASCFWVTDISQIVVLVGVVHGFGIGLSYMQTPVIIAQYFTRYTATATAISYAGGTVGSFIFPPLIESVIANYGLKGSFLIIGGILLNGLPFAMLLRPPIPADEGSFSLAHSHQKSTNETKVENNRTTNKNKQSTLTSLVENSNNKPLLNRATLSRPSLRPGLHHKLKRKRSGNESSWLYLRKRHSFNLVTSTSTYFSAENIKVHKKQAKTMGAQFGETELLVMESMVGNGSISRRASKRISTSSKNSIFKENATVSPGQTTKAESTTTTNTTTTVFVYPTSSSSASFSAHLLHPNHSYSAQQQQQTQPLLPHQLYSPSLPSSPSSTLDSQSQLPHPNLPPRKTVKHKYCQTVLTAKPTHFAHTMASIITNPMYLILLITHVSFQWAWMTYQMVIFDFGIDQQLSRQQSVSILIGFAVSDLFGRITSGWIADRQIIKKNHIVSICILCIGFFIQLTSMISSYRTHLTLTVLLGFTCGVIIVLFNLLTMEYVGLDNLPVALGLSAFFVGVTSLARPYVIGLFRDVIGSYIGLFRFVGTLSFIAALLWLMEPFAILQSKRRTTSDRQTGSSTGSSV
ncbi:hypothetical protein TYRP_009747 [Tyrophagus putrescentiae]|nr:hypothetical protein TYRP_009747 [Tyrophagus putrescentiae]